MKVTATQAAEIVNRDRTMVFRWVQDGALPAERISAKKIILIDLDDLRVFARARKLKINEELVRQYASA
jgi:predicted site-specific integrase-resolvase